MFSVVFGEQMLGLNFLLAGIN